MRTYEEFIERIKKSKGTKPGDRDYFPFLDYLGIEKTNNQYKVRIGFGELGNHGDLSFFEAMHVLMNGLSESAGGPNRFEIEFSDNIGQEEKDFIVRLCRIVRTGARCGSILEDIIRGVEHHSADFNKVKSTFRAEPYYTWKHYGLKEIKEPNLPNSQGILRI